MIKRAIPNKLEALSSRFYIYFIVSPTQDAIVDIYNINKFGDPMLGSQRQYRGQNLQEAIDIAYHAEIIKDVPKLTS